LRCRHARVRHRPIGDELAEKKALGKPERLRPGEEQLLRFFDLFLPLNLCFGQKVLSVPFCASARVQQSRYE